eukprot:3341235-Amphidinium_carterae.1
MVLQKGGSSRASYKSMCPDKQDLRKALLPTTFSTSMAAKVPMMPQTGPSTPDGDGCVPQTWHCGDNTQHAKQNSSGC